MKPHDTSCAIIPWTRHENLSCRSPAAAPHAVRAREERACYLQISKKLFLRLAWKFLGWASSVHSACWGQALRMNLKQPRASWDAEDALTTPCCRRNSTARCFADLHFGVKISLVLFVFCSFFWPSSRKITLADFLLLMGCFISFKHLNRWNLDLARWMTHRSRKQQIYHVICFATVTAKHCFSISTANR